MNWFFDRSLVTAIQLRIEDLHCQMCAQTVRETLQRVAGVKKVKVYLSQKRVEVVIAAESEMSVASLIKALEPTGYRAEPILSSK